MLNFFGPNPSRRSFLKLGTLGLAGLTLPDLLRLRANTTQAPSTQKAIIYVYLFGGPSHIDTYDMKPDAPEEYRGEFRPTRTNVPGFDFCDLMPLQAKIADKLALIRNLKFNPNFHDPVELLSGFKKPTEAGTAVHPDLGSVVSRLRQNQRQLLPSYFALDELVGERFRNGPAYLGLAHKAFVLRGNLDNFSLNRNVSLQRLNDRTALLRHFDAMSRDLETARADMQSIDHFSARALDMIVNPRVREAFDIEREPLRLRERYGPGEALRLLQARRLVEAGVPVVTLTFGELQRECMVPGGQSGWDTHNSNFNCLRMLLPRLDRAVHALITDLNDRGLSDDVAVIVGGEMGRSPQVGKGGCGASPDGRGHWNHSGFSLMAGGGLKMGQVIGRTDRRAERPIGNPYTPQNLLATLYHVLGIDLARTTLPDHNGRPTFLLDDCEPVKELI